MPESRVAPVVLTLTDSPNDSFQKTKSFLNAAEKCGLVDVSLKSFSLDHIQTGITVDWTSVTTKTYRGEGNDVCSIAGSMNV
jgi:hypothetical protein